MRFRENGGPKFHPSGGSFGKNSIRISGGGSVRFIRRLCPVCYIRKIRSIRKIARLDGKVQIERRSPSPLPSSPRLASDNRSLIAFVIPIINNASIVTEEEREGRRWVAGELNALTRIIGLRWMVNGKYTGTAVIEYKTRLLRSIIAGLNCTGFRYKRLAPHYLTTIDERISVERNGGWKKGGE